MSRNIFDPKSGEVKQNGWTFGSPAPEAASQQPAPSDNKTLPESKTYPDPDRIPFDPEHSDISQIEDL